MSAEIFFSFLIVAIVLFILLVFTKGKKEKQIDQLEEPVFNAFQEEPVKKEVEKELDPVDLLSTPDFLEDDVKPKKRAKKATAAKKPRKKKGE